MKTYLISPNETSHSWFNTCFDVLVRVHTTKKPTKHSYINFSHYLSTY